MQESEFPSAFCLLPSAFLAKGDKNRIEESDLPRLWIFSPTASESTLNGFKTNIDEENWGIGIHFLGDYLRTAIVAIHQLPRTEETLWLRIWFLRT